MIIIKLQKSDATFLFSAVGRISVFFLITADHNGSSAIAAIGRNHASAFLR